MKKFLVARRQTAAQPGIFSSRHGQDVGEQGEERAGQEHHAGGRSRDQVCHDRCNDDDRDGGDGEHAVIDEQSDQLARNAGEHSHGATSSGRLTATAARAATSRRSEEHTSELQSPCNLVCRLLLEKKNNIRVNLWLNEIWAQVTDSAPAIAPADDLPLFDRFYHVDTYMLRQHNTDSSPALYTCHLP